VDSFASRPPYPRNLQHNRLNRSVHRKEINLSVQGIELLSLGRLAKSTVTVQTELLRVPEQRLGDAKGGSLYVCSAIIAVHEVAE
jgi:hypothetical protein